MDILSADSVRRVINSFLTESKRISVVYTDEVDEPRTDGEKTIWLPLPEVYPSSYEEYIFRVYHELGHLTPRGKAGCKASKEAQASGRWSHTHQYVWNLIEDCVQEYDQHGQYKGKDSSMSLGRERSMMNSLVGNEGRGDPKFNDLWELVLKNYSQFYPDIPKVEKYFEQNFERAGLVPSSWVLLGMSENDVVDLTYYIVDDIWKLPPESEGEGEGEEESEGEGEEESEGEGEGRKPTEVMTDPLQEDDDSHDFGESFDTKTPREVVESTSYGDFIPADPAGVIEVSSFKEEDTYELLPEAESLYVGMGVAKKFKRELRTLSKAMVVHGVRRGKISSKALYRGAMREASHSYQNRIHKEKKVTKTFDTDVFLLCDMSGSMLGSRATTQAAIAAHVMEALTATKGLTVSINGFSEGRYVFTKDDREAHPVHYNFKKVGEQVAPMKLIRRMLSATYHQNSDGESILYGYKKFLRTSTAKRKMLLVTSDGAPACDRFGDVRGYTKRVIEGIYQEGLVELIGIGIESELVKDYYQKYIILNSVSQLETQLINLLKRGINNVYIR